MSDFPTRVEAIDRLSRNMERFQAIYQEQFSAAISGVKAPDEEAMRVAIAVAARDAALNAFLIAVYGDSDDEPPREERGRLLQWPGAPQAPPDA